MDEQEPVPRLPPLRGRAARRQRAILRRRETRVQRVRTRTAAAKVAEFVRNVGSLSGVAVAMAAFGQAQQSSSLVYLAVGVCLVICTYILTSFDALHDWLEDEVFKPAREAESYTKLNVAVISLFIVLVIGGFTFGRGMVVTTKYVACLLERQAISSNKPNATHRSVRDKVRVGVGSTRCVP
jgi:hypothetical protein